MANTNDTACDRTNHTSNSTPVTITNHFELFTALVGSPDEHQYKFPWDDSLLEAIDGYLQREMSSNTRAIEAMALIFVDASTSFFGQDFSLNQDEPYYCEETRALMSHIATLAGQIKDNNEIRATLSIEISRRQRAVVELRGNRHA